VCTGHRGRCDANAYEYPLGRSRSGSETRKTPPTSQRQARRCAKLGHRRRGRSMDAHRKSCRARPTEQPNFRTRMNEADVLVRAEQVARVPVGVAGTNHVDVRVRRDRLIRADVLVRVELAPNDARRDRSTRARPLGIDPRIRVELRRPRSVDGSDEKTIEHPHDRSWSGPKPEKHLPRCIDGQGCFAKLGGRRRDSTHARPTRSRATRCVPASRTASRGYSR
jgi:hypothetical protein